MAAEVEPRQYWVRSENGKTWGPVTFATLDLFVTNKVIQGRCQLSVDGQRFADPGRFPDARDAFPQEMWGSTELLPGLEVEAPPVVGPPQPGGRPMTGRPSAPPVMTRPAGPPTVGPPRVGPPVVSAAPVVPAAKTESGPKPGPPVVTPTPRNEAAPKTDSVPAFKPPDPSATSGELGEESIFRLYYRLAATQVSGALKVSSGGTTYEIFLKKGVPQQVRSDAPNDSVLQYMGEKGLLSAEAVTRAETAAPQFGGDPIGAAFSLGLVSNPGDFVAALSGHSVGLLKTVLGLDSGSWSFDPSAAAPPTASPLGNKWGLLMQGIRALRVDEARKRLGENLTAPVMKSGNLVTQEELALTAQEARVAANFNGVQSLAQLCESLGDADTVIRVGYALFEVELAGFAYVRPVEQPKTDAVPKVEARPPPPAAPPKPSSAGSANKPAAATRPTPAAAPRPPPVVGPAKPGAPAARPPPPAAPARPPPTLSQAAAKPAPAPPPPSGMLAPVNPLDVAALQALVPKLDKASHFDVLGVPKNANGGAVKVAYLQLVKSWHPDTAPADAPPELRPLREKVFARINDANTVLSDDKTRAEYLDELEHGGDEKVDVAKFFKAEDLFTKACIITKARKYAEALAMFDEAIKLNDQEAEFHAWRAYAFFMTNSDKRAAFDTAMKGINNALKLQPKCAQAAYFAGQMHKLLNDAAGAGTWFKKTLAIDANHLDAQRELRLMK